MEKPIAFLIDKIVHPLPEVRLRTLQSIKFKFASGVAHRDDPIFEEKWMEYIKLLIKEPDHFFISTPTALDMIIDITKEVIKDKVAASRLKQNGMAKVCQELLPLAKGESQSSIFQLIECFQNDSDHFCEKSTVKATSPFSGKEMDPNNTNSSPQGQDSSVLWHHHSSPGNLERDDSKLSLVTKSETQRHSPNTREIHSRFALPDLPNAIPLYKMLRLNMEERQKVETFCREYSQKRFSTGAVAHIQQLCDYFGPEVFLLYPQMLSVMLDGVEDFDENVTLSSLDDLHFIFKRLVTCSKKVLDEKTQLESKREDHEPVIFDAATNTVSSQEDSISLPYFAHETFIVLFSARRRHKSIPVIAKLVDILILILPWIKIHIETIAIHFGAEDEQSQWRLYTEAALFYLGLVVEAVDDVYYCQDYPVAKFSESIRVSFQLLVLHTFLIFQPVADMFQDEATSEVLWRLLSFLLDVPAGTFLNSILLHPKPDDEVAEKCEKLKKTPEELSSADYRFLFLYLISGNGVDEMDFIQYLKCLLHDQQDLDLVIFMHFLSLIEISDDFKKTFIQFPDSFRQKLLPIIQLTTKEWEQQEFLSFFTPPDTASLILINLRDLFLDNKRRREEAYQFLRQLLIKNKLTTSSERGLLDPFIFNSSSVSEDYTSQVVEIESVQGALESLKYHESGVDQAGILLGIVHFIKEMPSLPDVQHIQIAFSSLATLWEKNEKVLSFSMLSLMEQLVEYSCDFLEGITEDVNLLLKLTKCGFNEDLYIRAMARKVIFALCFDTSWICCCTVNMTDLMGQLLRTVPLNFNPNRKAEKDTLVVEQIPLLSRNIGDMFQQWPLFCDHHFVSLTIPTGLGQRVVNHVTELVSKDCMGSMMSFAVNVREQLLQSTLQTTTHEVFFSHLDFLSPVKSVFSKIDNGISPLFQQLCLRFISKLPLSFDDGVALLRVLKLVRKYLKRDTTRHAMFKCIQHSVEKIMVPFCKDNLLIALGELEHEVITPELASENAFVILGLIQDMLMVPQNQPNVVTGSQRILNIDKLLELRIPSPSGASDDGQHRALVMEWMDTLVIFFHQATFPAWIKEKELGHLVRCGIQHVHQLFHLYMPSGATHSHFSTANMSMLESVLLLLRQMSDTISVFRTEYHHLLNLEKWEGEHGIEWLYKVIEYGSSEAALCGLGILSFLTEAIGVEEDLEQIMALASNLLFHVEASTDIRKEALVILRNGFKHVSKSSEYHAQKIVQLLWDQPGMVLVEQDAMSSPVYASYLLLLLTSLLEQNPGLFLSEASFPIWKLVVELANMVSQPPDGSQFLFLSPSLNHVFSSQWYHLNQHYIWKTQALCMDMLKFALMHSEEPKVVFHFVVESLPLKEAFSKLLMECCCFSITPPTTQVPEGLLTVFCKMLGTLGRYLELIPDASESWASFLSTALIENVLNITTQVFHCYCSQPWDKSYLTDLMVGLTKFLPHLPSPPELVPPVDEGLPLVSTIKRFLLELSQLFWSSWKQVNDSEIVLLLVRFMNTMFQWNPVIIYFMIQETTFFSSLLKVVDVIVCETKCIKKPKQVFLMCCFAQMMFLCRKNQVQPSFSLLISRLSPWMRQCHEDYLEEMFCVVLGSMASLSKGSSTCTRKQEECFFELIEMVLKRWIQLHQRPGAAHRIAKQPGLLILQELSQHKACRTLLLKRHIPKKLASWIIMYEASKDMSQLILAVDLLYILSKYPDAHPSLCRSSDLYDIMKQQLYCKNARVQLSMWRVFRNLLFSKDFKNLVLSDDTFIPCMQESLQNSNKCLVQETLSALWVLIYNFEKAKVLLKKAGMVPILKQIPYPSDDLDNALKLLCNG